MTSMSWKTVCAAISESIDLDDLDEELDQIPHLSEDERSAIWLYAWAARDAAVRAADLTAA